MSYLQSIILGILQGIAEFLPISSSGHLKVARDFMDVPEIPALYDVILHVATLLVVLIFFRKIVWRLIKVFCRFIAGKKTPEDKDDLTMIWAVLIGTAITVVFGVLYEKLLDEKMTSTAVYALFIVTGLILSSTFFIQKKVKSRNNIKLRDGFIVGAAQSFALLPGVSRSGSTITAALASGVSREKAGEFSFVISIPAICGALILKLISEADQLSSSVSGGVIAAGTAASFVSGLAALYLLMKLIKGGKLYLFSIYLIPVGILGLAGVFNLIGK